MNSFYWTQSLLVIVVAILAFFISFGPSQNRAKWLTYLGIAASVALFVANQVVMSNTGDGLDKVLNCWINPAGVACTKIASTKQTAEMGQNNEKELRAKYKYGCDKGKSRDCTKLAIMLQRGEGGKPDWVNARIIYKRSCENGDYFGCVFLAYMLELGEGGAIDVDSALRFYKIACDGQISEGCSNFKRLTILNELNY